MRAAIVGSLVDDYKEFNQKDLFSSSIVLTSGNYPDEGDFGEVITGLDEAAEESDIVHFNTRKDSQNRFVTAGGRTLVVTANASTLEKAAKKMYESVDYINYTGMRYRKDIGKTFSIGC